MSRIHATGALQKFLKARSDGTATADEMKTLMAAAIAQSKANEPNLSQFLSSLKLGEKK
jgi:hypothetical protein